MIRCTFLIHIYKTIIFYPTKYSAVLCIEIQIAELLIKGSFNTHANSWLIFLSSLLQYECPRHTLSSVSSYVSSFLSSTLPLSSSFSILISVLSTTPSRYDILSPSTEFVRWKKAATSESTFVSWIVIAVTIRYKSMTKKKSDERKQKWHLKQATGLDFICIESLSPEFHLLIKF